MVIDELAYTVVFLPVLLNGDHAGAKYTQGTTAKAGCKRMLSCPPCLVDMHVGRLSALHKNVLQEAE